MSRLIDADVLLQDVDRKLFRSGIYERMNFALGLAQVVDECETADAEIREHGKWISKRISKNKFNYSGSYSECSVCTGKIFDFEGISFAKNYSYCPYCGALMDSERQEAQSDGMQEPTTHPLKGMGL